MLLSRVTFGAGVWALAWGCGGSLVSSSDGGSSGARSASSAAGDNSAAGGNSAAGDNSAAGTSGTGGIAGTTVTVRDGGIVVSSDAAAETIVQDDGSSTKCMSGPGAPGGGKTCKDLCDGYFKVCKAHPSTMDVYADQAACVSACKLLTQPQLCCRAQHAVTIASEPNPPMADLNVHCAHVIGMAPCT